MSAGHEHHSRPLSDPELRIKALEQVLTEKGLIDPAAVDLLIETYEEKVGSHNGAKVVARAWTDREYKQRLLEDGTTATAELGFSGIQGEDMVVVENTATVHNMLVCTLCSCYPWPTLGLPPVWYKSAPYRARAISEPRSVLKEFGVEISDDTEIRVWDSTAELRYMVLPERPQGTEHMSEKELAEMITRDSMIGVAKIAPPEK